MLDIILLLRNNHDNHITIIIAKDKVCKHILKRVRICLSCLERVLLVLGQLVLLYFRPCLEVPENLDIEENRTVAYCCNWFQSG